MKYFYCGSTQALLYALAHNNYIVVSPTETALEMCRVLDRELIEVKSGVSIKELITKPRKIKRELNRLINIMADGEIHFSHTQFAVFCFILISKARKRNIPIFFHDFEFVYPKKKDIKISFANLNVFFKKHIIDILYNIHLSFKDLNNGLVISIDNSFINQTNIKIIQDKELFYEQTLDFFINAPKLNITHNHVFLTQNLLKNNLFEKNSIIALYEFLIKLGICVKLHPGLKEEEANYFKQLIIPFNILPAEFIFNSIKYSIISVHSSALVTASKFNHLKSISLINLVVPNDKLFFEKVKDDLINKSSGKILFPNTFDELKLLINE